MSVTILQTRRRPGELMHHDAFVERSGELATISTIYS